jgi:membrane protease subunit HflC
MILAIPAANALVYTVSEQELAVLLQFGQPIASRTEPGLYFKAPFVQEVRRLPKTLQVWHGTRPSEKLVDVPTADGRKVEVTVWAVWRITDPVRFVSTLITEANGEARVKDFVRSAARNTITTSDLSEIVRSTNRKMTYTLGLPPEMVAAAGAGSAPGDAEVPDFVVPPEARETVEEGRLEIMERIKQTAQRELQGGTPGPSGDEGRGIELVDVGFSRIEFVPEVREAAFDRAIALMTAIAVKATSEGEQRKQEIINRTQAEVQKIEGEGKQQANVLRGRVEAEVIDAYAAAIRETGDFYAFTRNLEVLREALKADTRLILTTDSEVLRLLKQLGPMAAPPPAPEGSPEPAAAGSTPEGR